MNTEAPKHAWQVMVWGAVLRCGDWPGDPRYFESAERAKELVASKIAQGWDPEDVELVKIDVEQAALTWRPLPVRQWSAPQEAQSEFGLRVGPRGGVFTDAVTRDGRPYRRYF